MIAGDDIALIPTIVATEKEPVDFVREQAHPAHRWQELPGASSEDKASYEASTSHIEYLCSVDLSDNNGVVLAGSKSSVQWEPQHFGVGLLVTPLVSGHHYFVSIGVVLYA